jgi:hypothetical protein
MGNRPPKGNPVGGPVGAGKRCGSERGGQPCALVDGALCVQFGGHIGAADHMGGDAACGHRVGQAPLRLLPGAKHDGVGLDQPRRAVDGDMQALASIRS